MERRQGKRKKAPLIIALSLVSFLVLYFAGGIIAHNVVANVIFDKRGSDETSLSSKWYSVFNTQKDYETLQNRVIFSFSSINNEKLTGYFYSSPNPKGTVISLHGMGSLSDGDNAEFQDWFVKKGYNLAAIDLTASGRSEGKSMRGLHQSAYDAKDAYTYLLKENKIVSPLIMVGHSWGGFGAAASISLGVKADYVISFSAFDMPLNYMYDCAAIRVGPLAPITYPGFLLGIKMRFGENANLSASKALKDSNVKALLVHGEEDMTVRYSESLLYAAKDFPNVTPFSISNCGHDRPWLSEEAKQYAQESIAKIGEEFNKLNGEEAELALKEIGYDKNKASVLSTDLFSSIETFLA